jgi:SacI homology domain
MLSGPFLAVVVSSKKVFSDADTGIEVPHNSQTTVVRCMTLRCSMLPLVLDYTTQQYNKVTKMSLIPILKEPKQLTQQQVQHEAHLLQLLQSALNSHTLYHSNSYHVTHTLQRCAAMTVNSPTLLKQTSLSLGSYSQKANDQRQQVFTSDAQWHKADDRFFWNRNLVNSLIAAGADEWIMPLLNGHVEVKRNCRIGGTGKGKFTLLIVARRSRKQQGCRYIKRGCAVPGATSSCNGDVSNSCEIEQIVVPERGGVSSYVQVILRYNNCISRSVMRLRRVSVPQHCSEYASCYDWFTQTWF